MRSEAIKTEMVEDTERRQRGRQMQQRKTSGKFTKGIRKEGTEDGKGSGKGWFGKTTQYEYYL